MAGWPATAAHAGAQKCSADGPPGVRQLKKLVPDELVQLAANCIRSLDRLVGFPLNGTAETHQLVGTGLDVSFRRTSNRCMTFFRMILPPDCRPFCHHGGCSQPCAVSSSRTVFVEDW